MSKRNELLDLATWVRTVADANIELSGTTLRALARDIELIATRDAWVPHTLIALAFTIGLCGGLLWHAYVP